MFKLAWLTDPHLNFAGVQKAHALAERARAWRAGALVISGDIGESHDVEGWLTLLAQRAGCPIYFVLGNHDYYGAPISETREAIAALCVRVPGLVWLHGARPITLTSQVALVGVDGWGDARVGDALGSPVRLADFSQIEDLAGLPQPQLAARLRALGDESARALRAPLEEALSSHDVIVVTHVPPWREAAWHEGNISDDAWAPFFVCQAVGQVLDEAAAAHPHRQITVLCGHTHGGGELWRAPNLRACTGAAVYRHPALQAPRLLPGEWMQWSWQEG